MQPTLDALERALAPIEHIGRDEATFEADGVEVTLRVILPEEENEVQRYATKALPGPLGDDAADEATGVDQLDYVERFKIAILSHALACIGDQDFRDIEFIETNEVLDNGKNVRIERHVALRKLLHKWSGALRTRVFQKYAELLNAMELKAESAIVFEPSDVDTEITRLEERLERLTKMKEQKNASVASGLSAQVKSIAEMEQPFAEAGEEPPAAASDAPAPPEENPAPEAPEAPVATMPRQPITPQQVATPAPPQRPPDQPQVAGPFPEDVLPPQHGGTQVPPEMPDSFVDMSDTDNARDAMAREESRILEQRRRRAATEEALAEATPVAPEALDGPSDPRATRRPPHADVAAVEQAEGFVEAGKVGKVPAFRMPPEPLTRSADQQVPHGEPANINKIRGHEQSSNPRFKPPSGR